MTRNEFAALAAYVEAGFNSQLSDLQSEVWFDALHDLPAEAVKAAVKRCLLEREFPGLPPIGVIRRLAFESIDGQRLTAGEAWDRVLTAVRRHGYYDPAGGLKMLDPLTQKALRAVGGFLAVCDTTETGVLAGQFRRAYEALCEREAQHARLPADLRPRITNEPSDKKPSIVHSLADRLSVKPLPTGAVGLGDQSAIGAVFRAISGG